VRFLRNALLFGLALAALGSSPSEAGRRKVRLGTLAPSGSAFHKILEEMVADWSKETEGRIKMKIIAGGVAGDDPAMVRQMKFGKLGAGSLLVQGLAMIDPASNVFALPLFYESRQEVEYVIEKVQPWFRERMRKKGFELVNLAFIGWAHVFSKKPVKSLADVKKMKLFTWAGDDGMAAVWKRHGCRPVPLASSDVLISLQTDMIDAVAISPLAALSLQWYRHTPYMSDHSVTPLVGGTVVTKKVWAGLSKADRKAVLAGALRAAKKCTDRIPKKDAESVKEMEKRGLKVVRVEDAKKLEELRAFGRKVSASMRVEMVPAEAFDLVSRHVAEFRKARGRDK
jgi:TRAP-type C4-dicarboxylate transport system substrate-binding protein